MVLLALIDLKELQSKNGAEEEQVQYNCTHLQRTPQHCSRHLPRL